MITMSIPTQLLSSTAANAGEGLPSADMGEQSAQDFADLLAAAFAPVAVPGTPELISAGAEAQTAPAPDSTAVTSLPAPQTAYSLAITSEQQTAFRSSWSRPSQVELTNAISQTTNEAVIAPEAPRVQPEEIQAQAQPTAQLIADQPNTTPNSVATSFAQFLPLGNQIRNAQLSVTESQQAGKNFSFTDFFHGNEMPARAARAVKDIVAEPEAIEPTSQTTETRNFTEPEAAVEPLLPEQVEAAPTAEAQPTFTVQNATHSSAATTLSDKGAPPAIVTQTIHPIVDLAHQTPHRETRSLRFDLQPKELGRVEVEVSRDAAGNVSATLNAERSDAAQALTHSIGHLREALEQAGVKVEQLNVYSSAQFQQQPNGQPQQQHAERATPLEMLLPEATAEESATIEEEKLLNLRA